MTELHKFADGPQDQYLLIPEQGNALVISTEEVRAKGVNHTGFRFPMYNVRGYERPPQPGESRSQWVEATRPQSNLTDRSGIEPVFMTYPDVKVAPPLRDEGDINKALGIVGTAYINLQQDPTATLNIAADFRDAGVPFEQLTVELTTFRPPQA